MSDETMTGFVVPNGQPLSDHRHWMPGECHKDAKREELQEEVTRLKSCLANLEWPCPLCKSRFSYVDGVRYLTHGQPCECPEMPLGIRLMRGQRPLVDAERERLEEQIKAERERADSNYESCERIKRKWENTLDELKALARALVEADELLGGEWPPISTQNFRKVHAEAIAIARRVAE